MKKVILSIILALICILAVAQVPQGFNYQAVAHSSTGAPISNTTIQVKAGILSDTLKPVVVWEELHSTVRTNINGVFNLVIGSGVKQAGSASAFNDIDWTKTPLFLKIQINYQGTWKYMGSAKLWSVPYSMIAGDLNGAVDKLEVIGEDVTSDEALFEVKRKDGKTMFAVYNHGVRVYMPLDTLSKTRKGGFIIGGFDAAKGVVQDYFVVNPDSIRAYIDTNPEKTRKGGFAVGGFNLAKQGSQDYLLVSPDSIRVFLKESDAKTRKGGFAISGYDNTKGITNDFFNVDMDTSGIIDPAENRIMWYPLKNGFLTGKVLIESPDSVGENSFASGFESKAIGDYSQALGYKAIARGNYSTAIGKNAIAQNISSYAFGNGTIAIGTDSYALGSGAKAEGLGSFAFGSVGVDDNGNPTTQNTIARSKYSFALGFGSQATNTSAFALGNTVIASGSYSTAMGYNTIASGICSFAIGGTTTASGDGAIALGGATISSGFYSTAMGCVTSASGSYSTSTGYYTTASGKYSTAMGAQTTALSAYEIVMGRYNTTYTPASTFGWNPDDRLFVIGNGEQSYVRHNAMTVLKNGHIGLQTVATPTYALELPNNSAAGIGQVRAYDYDDYSDSRVKENQAPLTYGLKEIMRLLPKQYLHHSSIDSSTWSADNAPKTIGLVAQDVYDIIPEAVSVPVNDTSELWGLKYDRFIPVLVKAIQEQQQQIESFKSENDNLKSQLQSLQEEVEQIKAILATSGGK